MSQGTAVLIYLLLPAVVFCLPILVLYLRGRGWLPSLPKLARGAQFQGVSDLSRQEAAPVAPRSSLFLASAAMAFATWFVMDAMVVGGADGVMLQVQIRDALLVGCAAGAGIILFLYLAREYRSALGAANQLHALGAIGVWNSAGKRSLWQRLGGGLIATAEELLAKARIFDVALRRTAVEEPSFRESVCVAAASASTLHAITADGSDILSLIAHDPNDITRGPTAPLRSARLRLLVLPPRSSRVDPERKKLSCSEVALSRIDRTPEEHWRHLKNSLDILHHWANEFGVQVDVRFLESRPAFQCVIAGPRVWAAPWGDKSNRWLGSIAREDGYGLADGFKDYFMSEWAIASTELDLPLTEGSTGSTVIRKGIEIPEENVVESG